MKLSVSNFQIHKTNTVEIPEGETTYLEGDSDTGKSAMLRAIRWLCENKPDGGSFVTFKTPRGTTSAVRLEFDGHVAERERGKSKNVYRLDGETFEAFGRSVPEPILKALNLSPYAFQCQGEVPFLIGASATEAAKILSDACGLGVIDTAVGHVRQKKIVVEADIRKTEILLESAKQHLQNAAEQLPLADALEAAAALGDEVEALNARDTDISAAIEMAPQGELLDLAATQDRAAAARALEIESKLLLNTSMAMHAAVIDEPEGALFELGDTALVVEAARTNLAVYDACLLDFRRLSAAIADEPRGEIVDVSVARARFGEAKVIGEWLADVSKSAARMRQHLADEPKGEEFKLEGVALLLIECNTKEQDADILRDMVKTMRSAILAEPTGVLIDTAELMKQRAQIKVCPTCGKEL